MSNLQNIQQKVLEGDRLSRDEALSLYLEGTLFDLGFLADSIRRTKHPEPVVTYIIDRNINYTDICISACKFCAFYKTPEDSSGYLLAKEELRQKIEETLELAGLTDLADRKVRGLSGGERQRLGVAEAWIGHPDVSLYRCVRG